jgi:hypothetical protein
VTKQASRWLTVVGAGLTVGGVAMALLAGTDLFAPINSLIEPAFWSSAPDAADVAFRSWVFGAWGATLAGWGLFVAFVASGPFRRGEAWSWWAIAAGTSLWFVLDTGVSLVHGVGANVALNVGLAALVAVPLAMSHATIRGRST